MKYLNNFLLGLLIFWLAISYIGSTVKNKDLTHNYLELQDNYEAISKGNEELRDSLNYLKLSPIINKSPNYEDTFQTR